MKTLIRILLALLVVACHDNTTIPLESVKQNSVPLGFRAIYRQPPKTSAYYEQGYKFPYYKSLETGEIAPDSSEYGRVYGDSYKDSDYIEIPADGELEISGNLSGHYPETKLFVYIDGKYSETLVNTPSRVNLPYGHDFRVKNIPVKEKQKLTLFSPQIGGHPRTYPKATVSDLIIYFKPK